MHIDLSNALIDMNEQMDRIKKEMEGNGASRSMTLFHDLMIRNALVSMITIQYEQVPIEEADDAMVAALSTILFNYMQRTHAKGSRSIVVEHLKLLFDDMKERLAFQVRNNFTNDPPKSKIKLVKH